VGPGEPGEIERMLGAIDYRGDHDDIEVRPNVAFGFRSWEGRAKKASTILREPSTLVVCAGTFAPPVESPTEWLRERLVGGNRDLGTVDGAFAFAHWDESTRALTLGRDPFGVRSLYYLEHRGAFYFATELKQLLTIPGLRVEIDPSAIHKYLTFSFVPGEAVPIVGVKRLLPGHTLRLADGNVSIAPYFKLVEQIDEKLQNTKEAVKTIRRLARDATKRRLHGEGEVGLFLSGGLDSSSVAVWLKDAGASARAFSLDFGEQSVEREQAAEVAQMLGIPQTMVPVTGDRVAAVFDDAVYKLDLPFGDPVTVPQYLLGKAARDAGLSAVFNGEGGDQLFGGWTSKPMIAAEVYAGLYESQATSREETYLRSYHRFYGLEDELYAPEFRDRVGPAGQRRALLRPYLEDGGDTLLHRVRLADISLKGSQNILPRAERMANAWGLDVLTPLFDRQLAETAFRLPPDLKLHGACEKYVLKLAMRKRLPKAIVWRKKFGMSVPITDFVLQPPLSALVEDLVGDAAVRRRGLFRPEFVRTLRAGQAVPSDTRRRRVGERIWTLMMLEAWMRRFVDHRGASA
jgi:asparagine synthase (glutamine-hydrolysing)